MTLKLTVRAAVVSPTRVKVNVPVSAGSLAAASVAATHHMCIREQGPRPQSGLRG